MEKILLPFDGSASALHGLAHVLQACLKGEVREVHVLNVQPPFSAHVCRYSDPEARAEYHREQADAELAAARRALATAGVPHVEHREVGDSAQCIVAAAQRLQCDGIVIGTSRKSALVRLVEGSIINRVIAHATVPVEVIAGDAPSTLERIGIPAGIGTGITALCFAAVE